MGFYVEIELRNLFGYLVGDKQFFLIQRKSW